MDQHLESMKKTMDLEFCPSRMKVKQRHFEKRENGRIYHQEIHITVNAKESSLGQREMTPARKLYPQKVIQRMRKDKYLQTCKRWLF